MIFYLKQKTKYTAKLSDCGLDLYFTKSGQIISNNKYLISAPEYILGRKIAKLQRINYLNNSESLASDIYSLGVILVVLLKGRLANNVSYPLEKMQCITYVDFSWKDSKNSIKRLFAKKEYKQINTLLKGMLERKVENRFDIMSVKNHPLLHI